MTAATIVGLDTATGATAVALVGPDGAAFEARDELQSEQRPRHTEQVLVLIEKLFEQAQLGWSEVERIAVGVGPGGFTGLRIGVATARALAQAADVELVGVSSLRALAAACESDVSTRPVAAVIDARRDQIFAAVWSIGSDLRTAAPIVGPQTFSPEQFARAVTNLTGHPIAIGDGALRYRAQLKSNATIPEDDCGLHRISAIEICRIGALGAPVERSQVVPDYCRQPDAKPPRSFTALGS